jgi:hypothetical protein
MDAGSASRQPSTMEGEHSREGSAGWWIDRASTSELVERVVEDIDGRSRAERDILLSHMLSAAWPAPRSQLQ